MCLWYNIPAMNAQINDTSRRTPGLISSLTSGFNLAANHVQLILLPVLIDLILWFGPRIRIQKLLSPLITDLYQTVTSYDMEGFATITESSRQLWMSVLDSFNILNLLRTYPIGVPSLMAGQGSLASPLGSPLILEIPNWGFLFLSYIVVLMVGSFLGVYYFSEISRFGMNPRPAFSIQQVIRYYLQIVLFSLILLLALVIIGVPMLFLLSILLVINPFLMQLGTILIGFTLLWLLIPLIFSTHGIFTYQNNILAAMLNSARLVRFFLPTTGFFIIAVILISEGLDIIWMFPPDSSWMTMIGIIGHAFISTGLVASSFSFFREGMTCLNRYTASKNRNIA